MSLESNRSYPGGGYILWKRQLEDKQGQGKGDKISVQQSDFTQPISLPDAPATPPIPGTRVLPVLPWALGK